MGKKPYVKPQVIDLSATLAGFGTTDCLFGPSPASSFCTTGSGAIGTSDGSGCNAGMGADKGTQLIACRAIGYGASDNSCNPSGTGVITVSTVPRLCNPGAATGSSAGSFCYNGTNAGAFGDRASPSDACLVTGNTPGAVSGGS